MPEIKKVYNQATGEEAAMYAVDAKEAIRNGKGDWSYFKKGEERPGMPPMVVSDQTLVPGVLKGPDEDDERIPDGFGPERGQAGKVHYQSGETRMLVKEGEGGQALAIQPYARRATKAEQIAASNDGSEQSATRYNDQAVKSRKSASRRKPVKRKKAKKTTPAPAPAEE
jgi:hypothetical protein